MSIYQHFREDERPFIDRVLEWKTRIEERYTPVCTDFLDPRQQEIVKGLIGTSSEIGIRFSGGYEAAERKRALLLPKYSELNNETLGFFELKYPKKFASIDHPSLLGSLLGLGVKREKLGDLLFSGDRIQWVAAEEIGDFLKANLTHVGRHAVSCEEIQSSDLVMPEWVWESKQGFVASLRSDAVLAEIFHLSRTKASDFISSGKVKVNWKMVDKPAYELQAGDQISVRKFGRARIEKIEGMTKRGNLRIEYSFLK